MTRPRNALSAPVVRGGGCVPISLLAAARSAMGMEKPPALRAWRNAIDREPVRERERHEDAALLLGNEILARRAAR